MIHVCMEPSSSLSGLLFINIQVLCFSLILAGSQAYEEYTVDAGHYSSTPLPPSFRESVLNWTEPPDAIFSILQNPRRYNKHIAPGQHRNITTTVSVGFYIESMSSFRTASMDFEIDIYLATFWTDQRLTHNLPHPVLINDYKIVQYFWQPDLYFVNSKQINLHAVASSGNFMMLVYPDGMVFKSMRIAVTLSCVMDLAWFPLDEQTCPIVLQSYAFTEPIVNITWFTDDVKGFPIGYNPDIRLNDMVIINRTYEVCSYWYQMLRGKGTRFYIFLVIWTASYIFLGILGYWSCLKGLIRMKRRIGFHVLQTYIPTALLVVISFLSFWLDPGASAARVGLTITTLLTLTTMGNGARSNLPQVSYVKAIDIWLSLCTGFVFTVLLEYTFVCFYIGRKNTQCNKHVSHVVKPMVKQLLRFSAGGFNTSNADGTVVASFGRPCCDCSAVDEKRALRIDYASRALFPIAFAACAISYWTIYLWAYLQVAN